MVECDAVEFTLETKVKSLQGSVDETLRLGSYVTLLDEDALEAAIRSTDATSAKHYSHKGETLGALYVLESSSTVKNEM